MIHTVKLSKPFLNTFTNFITVKLPRLVILLSVSKVNDRHSTTGPCLPQRFFGQVKMNGCIERNNERMNRRNKRVNRITKNQTQLMYECID